MTTTKRKLVALLGATVLAVPGLSAAAVTRASADPAAPAAGPDLAAALTSSTTSRDFSVRLGVNATLHATVTNNGSAPAANATATFTFATPIDVATASASAGGSCMIAEPHVTCSWTTIAAGANVTVDLQANSAVQVGTFATSVVAANTAGDANNADNTATAPILVTSAPKQIAPATWQVACSAALCTRIDGSLAPAKVDDIVYVDDVEYIVGTFDSVISPDGSQTFARKFAAAVQVSTGNLLPWNPQLDGTGAGDQLPGVRVVSGRSGLSSVYLGGLFNTAGGVTHNNLVAVEPAIVGGATTAGNARALNFNPFAEVKALAITADGGRIFAGGLFRNANGGVTRNFLASWQTATATLDAWAPSVEQDPNFGTGFKGGDGCPPRCVPAVWAISLSPDGQGLYVGGSFAAVGLTPQQILDQCYVKPTPGALCRNSAAEVSTADGSLMAWNPNVFFSSTAKGSQNTIYDMSVFNGNVLLCGDFWRVGGDDNAHVHTNVAAVDGANGILLPGFDVHTDGAVNGCTTTGTELILGGHFQKVGPTPQGLDGSIDNHIVAVDMATGAVDPGWNPYINSNQGVYVTRVGPGRLGVGGEFDQVNVRDQQGAAEFLYPSAPAGPAVSLNVSGLVSPRTAGAAGTVTITALDGSGNIATSYRGRVHLTSTDPAATLAGDYTFTGADNGKHNLAVTLKKSGTQSVTATDTVTASITGAETSIVVNAGPAAVLSVSGIPSPIGQNVAGTFGVIAVDGFGNVATGYTGTVHITSSDTKAKLPADYTFVPADGGAKSFLNGVEFATVGTQSVTATDKATASIKGSQTGINVTAHAQGSGNPDHGYWLSTSDGGVFNFGTAPNLGSVSHLNKPVVGMAPTPTGNGFWLVATDGGIFSFGDAHFFGSTGSVKLNKPIVGMASTPTGNGYYLVASDGGLFTFGDAHYLGSTGNITLNKPVVGMTMTPSGNGYQLVASDGGIFNFGDSRFFGSTGAITLNQPIVGMATNPTNTGYWLYAADGGIFTFGSVGYFGSGAQAGSQHLASRAVGAVSTSDGLGYWIYDQTGEVKAFGSALFFGQPLGSPLPFPIAAMAARP